MSLRIRVKYNIYGRDSQIDIRLYFVNWFMF